MTKADDGPDGLLLVDKPVGPTSHDVVRWVRKALRTRRVGHAGTLDPFATGLLACGIGRATRLLRWYSESAKTYEGVILLGFATDSGDSTGIALGAPSDCGDAAERAAGMARERLTGDLQQVPPMHSAKKVDGVPLHRLARRGEVIERAPVAVRVTDWQLEPIDARRVRFRVTCSSGTYVRVLARDLGEMLGCGAHLESLRRVSSGALRIEDAVPAADLAESGLARLVPIDVMPLPLPDLRCLDAAAERAFHHGASSPRLAWEGASLGGHVACRSLTGHLLGIALLVAGEVRPDVVVATQEP